MSEESTNSASDESPVSTFDLTCVACEYSEVLEGTEEDVLEAVEAHRKEGQKHGMDHFVEFERRM